MEILKLSGNEGIASIRAAGVLRSGGVILYPTDTLYGLGADAFSDEAVDKIYAIKGRDMRKPTHAMCADMHMVEEYAEVNDTARKLAEKFLPGALTLVLKKKSNVTGGIGRNMQTIGVRIPDNSFCIELARSLGKPFTATSANLADAAVGFSVEEILIQLGPAGKKIDLVIDAGMLPMRPPSTVVSLVSGAVDFLRIGAIPRSEIENVL
jgi:L-threonylcarbamoyladenylate synthase